MFLDFLTEHYFYFIHKNVLIEWELKTVRIFAEPFTIFEI